ncbi:MAG: hypothetical protein JWL90_49 [Chthoniobacteraceae bacterium]|nr:hypothetical protein [Chthoniobacteraceae bacterium]
METPNFLPAFCNAKRAALVMRKLILFALLISSSLGAFGGDFEEANNLFDKGNFADARTTYEKLVQRGDWSANLFCNLGDTELRLGEPGRAILQYKRALALEPAHREATRNLQVVRDQAGSHVAVSPISEAIFPRVSLDVFVIAATVMGWLAIVLLVRLFIRRTAPAILSFIFCVAAALYAGSALWHQHREVSLAVITRPKPVEARLAPADRAGLAESLPPGSQVRVLSERGEWTYCELPGKGLGWIPSTALEKVRIVRS